MPAAGVQTYAELAARVRAAPLRTGTTRVVAVDGPSGAGKTTFAGRLAAVLDAPVVHMDDLYPGWDGLAAGIPRLLGWVLAPLRAGRVPRYRRYDWERGIEGPWCALPASPVLVVEGVGSGARAAGLFLSLLVWVDAPQDLRMRRGIARDGEAFRPHWVAWGQQEDALFAAERTRSRADVRVDGSPRVPHDPATTYVRLP